MQHRTAAIGALFLIAGSLATNCSRVPTMPSERESHKAVAVPGSVYFFPDGGGGGTETLLTGAVATADPSVTVQILDYDGQTYARYEYRVYQRLYGGYDTLARGIGQLEALEAAGTIVDTTSLWVPDDSLVFAYAPIELGDVSAADRLQSLSGDPPPPPPPTHPPAPPADTTQVDSDPPIRRMTWGDLKKIFKPKP